MLLIETFCIFVQRTILKLFETIILAQADKFINKLDIKTTKKLFFVIRNAEENIDPKFFKKLRNEIWEFKVKFSNNQIRVLAFWDKTEKSKTLVIATNGFYKKKQKTPVSEIEKAEKIRKKYFETK